MRILFSPIGTTDPISNFKDGSMLHICRVYKPDLVYLYLSKEMLNFHENDNRYLYCLEQLGKTINHHFSSKIIKKPELINVQVYDVFYKEFNNCLKNIKVDYPDAQILLNISSGTPAMKSALNLIAVLSDFKLQSIQVSTPQKSFNPHAEDKINYDYKAYWELNEDNSENFENRCSEVGGTNQKSEISKQIIINHIKAYDYVAALSVSKSIQEFLDPHIIQMLRAAALRINLDYPAMSKALKDLTPFMIPVKAGDGGAITEYLLSMGIKVKRQEYADFLRAFTPVFNELLKLALKENCGIKIENYTFETKGSMKWKKDLENTHNEIYRILTDWYGDSFNGGWVSSDHLVAIISAISSNTQLKIICNELREIEEKVRNDAAHNLISVSAQYIEKRCGKSPIGIMKLLQRLTIESGIKIKEEGWHSYERMNENIISEIQLFC